LAQDSSPPHGNSSRTDAVVGANVVIAPGRSVPNAIILIRQGRIIALGSEVSIPAEAQRWDVTGKTIYPGFIDAYGELDVPLASLDEREQAGEVQRPAAHFNPRVAPQRRAEAWYQPDAAQLRRWRTQGFVARLVAPTGAVIQGTSCLVSTADPDRRRWLLQPTTALHLRLKPPRRGYHVGYPTSPMGTMALVRQSFLDAEWYFRTRQRDDWPLEPPRFSAAIDALARHVQSDKLVIIDAPDELYLLRADRLAREFGLNAAIGGSGEEYQRLAAVRQTGRTVIVPLAFPPAPPVDTPEAALNAPLERLLHWNVAPENPARLVRAGVPICLTAHGLSSVDNFLSALRQAVRRGLSPDDALRALTIAPAELLGVADRLGTLAVGKQASFIVADGDLFTSTSRVREVWIDGQRNETSEVQFQDGGSQKRLATESATQSSAQPAMFEVNYPLGAWGRSDEAPPPQQTVLFRDATIWTSGPNGVFQRGSVLISDGRIAAVGSDIKPPAGTLVIDARGKHLTAGLIDCHSHIATDGGLTEAGRTSTGEVRIADYLDDEDVDIYRQLAAGVTCVNLLPGSDNTICGQSQVIKLRWGQRADALVMSDAPPGMKFALGENARQSNWDEDFTARYPQTRMGVEQLLVDAFRAASAYRRQWDNWRRDELWPPPRVDLELEALAEVLAGKRRIHCHAYRQDEMLALVRTCAALGIPQGTFHHALEGYKIADVLASHQAMASIFADWWGFKFEAYDGIPYNGAMLRRAGVLVSINSDDAELARRLHVEAAKVMKYGGLSASEALDMVTINPARQLGIDAFVGSLEVGKQADLVLWSGSPLSALSLCEQTWIDGRKYFDREDDQRQRIEAERKKAALIQRVLAERHDVERSQ
jgi:imidazolonepropionase-like amidohydrolase